MLREPLHPYTQGLLGSYADPRAEIVEITYIPGRPPDLSASTPGCLFAPRCPEADRPVPDRRPAAAADRATARGACHVARAAALGGRRCGARSRERDRGVRRAAVRQVDRASRARPSDSPVLLAVDERHQDLRAPARARRSTPHRGGRRRVVRAAPGRVTALVGQSGSGKSTIARMVTGVERPTSGAIVFHGHGGRPGRRRFRGRALRDYRRHVQMVFQDPFSALNPTRTVGYALSRPLREPPRAASGEARARARRRAARDGRAHPGRPVPRQARRTSSPAGSASGSSSPGRWPPSRRSSSPTSRSRCSTCRSGPRSSSCSTTSSATAASPCSTSPTTCSAPGCSPTR